MHVALFGFEADDDAFLGSGIQRIAIERERRDHAADLRSPERAAVPQPDRVHPSIRLGLGGGVQPILVQEWPCADRSVHVAAPQDIAARAVHEDDVAIGGPDGDDGLAQRRAAAHAAAHRDVPEGPWVGVERLVRCGVVPRRAEVREPCGFLTGRALFRHGGARDQHRVDTEKARH